eukprot:gene11848-13080_t
MVIALLHLVQLACVLIWLKLDPVRMELFPSSDGTQIILECKVDLATSRLVCVAVPCLTLVSATLVSFWERNDEHPYNEPKFLSFTTMALTIIVVAFIPTFKFVVGTYKAVVMAFTVDVWAFTYIGCMFAPKMYAFVAQRFHNIGDGGAVPVNETTYSAHELNGSPDGDGSDGSAGSKNGSSASQRPDSVNGKQGKFSSKGPAREEIYLLKRISISSSPMAHRAGDGGTTEEHNFDHPVEPKFDNNSAKNLMCQT